MLTDAMCRKAKAGEKDYKLTDASGLYLYVTRAGFKSWRWKFRFAGKEKRLTLGPYPEVSLAEARDKRDAGRKFLRDGIDPSVEKKQRDAMRMTAAGNSFETIARDWHTMHKGTWAPIHAEDVLNSLVRDVFPQLGGLPITSITAPLLMDCLRAIENRGAIETARRVRQRMSAVFVHGIASGICENDPAAIVSGALKPLKKGRQPAFKELDQARALLRDSEGSAAHPLTKLASRLLALTAVRPGVLRRTPWTEINGRPEADLWLIPAARMKLDQDRKDNESFDFMVPLSRQALQVIEAARLLSGNCPYVFPGQRSVHVPMSENAIGYFYNRLPDYRGRHVPHGWRATFSTLMNEKAKADNRAGDREVIDLMLAHIPKGMSGSESAYNRAAYLPRRREIAQQWADMLLDGFPPAASLIEGRRK